MRVDRGVIDGQLREIGESDRWWEHREFRSLPDVLRDGEQIRSIATGSLLLGRLTRVGAMRGWLFVLTDQRLLCIQQQRFARRQLDILPGQVVRIGQRSGLRRFQVTLQTPERRYRIRLRKDDAFRFVNALGLLIPKPSARRLPPEIEPLSWIPGLATVAELPGFAGIVSKVAMLSPADPAPRDRIDRLEATVDRLQGEVAQLQQQVNFLEDILQERAEIDMLPASTSDG